MSIKAKFDGICKACGESFPAGTEIEWKSGKGSRHVTCPGTIVKSNVPLNSPGRAALQGRGRRDFFLGEKTEIQVGFTVGHRPSETELGRVFRSKDGVWLKTLGLAAHYVSQDEADDFDLVYNGSFSPHWSILEHCREATEEEIAPEQAREKVAADRDRLEHLCDDAGEWAHRDGRLEPEIDAQAQDRVRIWKKLSGYSLHQAWRTSIGLLSCHTVYEDSPVWRLLRWEDMKPEDADLIRAAKEVG